MRKKTISDAMTQIRDEYIEKAADYTVAKKARRTSWLKWASTAACLSLIVAGAILAGRSGVAPQISRPTTEIALSDTQQPETDRPTVTEQAPDRIVVHSAENRMSADMDVQFTFYDTLSVAEKEAMRNRFEAETGREYPTQVPDAFYSVDVPSDTEGTQYLPHDYVFEYRIANGGSVRIALCAKETPLRDYFFDCDSSEPSQINGVSVTIYEYRGAFTAYFTWQRVHYDIQTENLTEAELTELLKCIMS